VHFVVAARQPTDVPARRRQLRAGNVGSGFGLDDIDRHIDIERDNAVDRKMDDQGKRRISA
jgi:hypothetical protein